MNGPWNKIKTYLFLRGGLQDCWVTWDGQLQQLPLDDLQGMVKILDLQESVLHPSDDHQTP